MKDKILRLPQVISRTGQSRSTIYERINEGTFPPPIKLGCRSVGWIEREIDEWIADCIAKSRNNVSAGK